MVPAAPATPTCASNYSGGDGANNHLLFWNADHGDLSKVAFTTANGTSARVTLTAGPGWVITSLSFDMAGWSHADIGARVLRIGFGALDDLAGTTIQGDGNGPQRGSFSYSSSAGETSTFIEWGTNWNIGIDNIVFTVARAASGNVPEPLSLALAAAALGLMGLARRRQQR